MGGDVAEVAAGHAYHHVVRPAFALELGIGVEVVEGLRQEAGHVDGVGAGEHEAGVQLAVHEGGLDQGLAVVEGAVHLEGGDVAPQRGELLLLDVAHLAFGIEHVHMDAFHAKEAVGHRAARVAGRGHEDVHLPAAVFAADKVAQQACHEACTHILEGQRGAVEEFERADAVRHAHQGDVEVQRVVHDVAQGVGGDVLTEEGVGHVGGHFRQGHVADAAEEAVGQAFNLAVHVKAFVGRKAAHHGLLEGSFGRIAVGTVLFHIDCVRVMFLIVIEIRWHTDDTDYTD